MGNILMTCITSMFFRQKRKLKLEAKIHFRRQISFIFLEINSLLMESSFQLNKKRSQFTKPLSKNFSHAKEKCKSSSKSLNHHTQKKISWKFYNTSTEDMVKKNLITITYHWQKHLKSVFQKAKMISKFIFSRNFLMNQKSSCQSFQKRVTS